MHIIYRESHGLDETATPVDLAQSSADLVVLSFSDSDLNAFAEGWRRARDQGHELPSLRLANLGSLAHPLSVDVYVEQTLEDAKAILIRLIGGVSYWSHGVAEVQALARRKGIVLAVLPADGRPDPKLDAASTVPHSTLHRLNHLCNEGGAVAAQAALAQLALSAGLYAGPVPGLKTVPPFGAWTPETGIATPVVEDERPLVAVVFYRAYLISADTKPIGAMVKALRARGCSVVGFFAPSLKEPNAAAWLEEQLVTLKPSAIINATSFSGKGGNGRSPLDAAGVPVFQVALATSEPKGLGRGGTRPLAC